MAPRYVCLPLLYRVLVPYFYFITFSSTLIHICILYCKLVNPFRKQITHDIKYIIPVDAAIVINLKLSLIHVNYHTDSKTKMERLWKWQIPLLANEDKAQGYCNNWWPEKQFLNFFYIFSLLCGSPSCTPLALLGVFLPAGPYYFHCFGWCSNCFPWEYRICCLFPPCPLKY